MTPLGGICRSSVPEDSIPRSGDLVNEEVKFYFNKGGMERLNTINRIEARGEWAIVQIPDEMVIGKECEVWEVWVGGRLFGPCDSFAAAENDLTSANLVRNAGESIR
jgi:hypothetical protein